MVKMNTIKYLKNYWRGSKTESTTLASQKATEAERPTVYNSTAGAQADTPDVTVAQDVASPTSSDRPKNVSNAQADPDAPGHPTYQKFTAVTLPGVANEVGPVDGVGPHSSESTHDAAPQDGPDQQTNGKDPDGTLTPDKPSFDFTFRRPPAGNDSRPKLQPKHQPSRHRRDITPPDEPPNLADQVVMEDFNDPNDPKPKGYMGTLGGEHIIARTVEDYCPCGTGGGHYVICGHTVVGDKACGPNCKLGGAEQQPFNCPQCREILDDVISNKLTPEEQTKLKMYYEEGGALTAALCVEYVSKHLSTATGNIAETVMSIIATGYGRACRAVIDAPVEQPTLTEMFNKHHNTLQEKTRARSNKEKFGALITDEKRKGLDEETSSANSDASSSTAKSDTPAPSHSRRKKRKNKLRTHREPIPETTRGTKRAASDEDSFSEGDTLIDTPPHTKKLKQKLENHRQPIPRGTHGTKRKSEEVTEPDKPSKVVTLTAFKHPGDAEFLPTPSARVVLGELERKRGNDAIEESNKRGRMLEEMPECDDDVEIGIGGTEKNRMSMEE